MVCHDLAIPLCCDRSEIVHAADLMKALTVHGNLEKMATILMSRRVGLDAAVVISAVEKASLIS